METMEQKFERSRKRFKQNLDREKARYRRTIFLNEDESPGTSNGGPHKHRRQQTNRNRATPSFPQKPTSGSTNTAHHRRMTVPPHQAAARPVPVDTTPVDTIVLSDDEEPIPPPPPFISSEEENGDEPPPPPKWDEGSITLDDLCIQPEDLDDPFIQEFVRSFCGETNTMVDIRPPTPPSPPPPSSPSSIDWENENFRPPTPPRRRGFGTLDIDDRQYTYLGMHCYERVWRARVLVPRMKATPAVMGVQAQHSSQETDREVSSPSRSPRQSGLVEEPAVPVTPGRGWLNHPCYHAETPAVGANRRPSMLSCQTTLPRNAPRISSQNSMVDQMPLQLQQEIEERTRQSKGTRTRFTHTIHGQQYRITVARNGEARVTLL